MGYIDLDEDFRWSTEYEDAKVQYAKDKGYVQCSDCKDWHDSDSDLNGDDNCSLCRGHKEFSKS